MSISTYHDELNSDRHISMKEIDFLEALGKVADKIIKWRYSE